MLCTWTVHGFLSTDPKSMRAAMDTLLITSLLITTLFSVTAANSPITCTAGEFMKFMSGSVTCKFNENLKQARKNFNIVQYPFNKGSSGSDTGTYVLVCNWGQGDSLDCKTEAGFSFNKQVSDRITLDIPDVTTSVGGVYVCQMVPDNGVPLETCTLKVKDFSLPMAGAGAGCPKVDCGPEDIFIAVLILIVILLIICLVFVIIFTRRRFHCVQRKGDPTKDHCICCGLTSRIERKQKHKARSILIETVGLQTETEHPLLSPVCNTDMPGIYAVGFEQYEPVEANVGLHVPGIELNSDQQKQSQKNHRTDTSSNVKQTNDANKHQHLKQDNQGEGSNHDLSGSKVEQLPLELNKQNYANWTTNEVVEWLKQNKVPSDVLNKIVQNNVEGSMLAKDTKKMLQSKGLGLSRGEQRTVHSLVETLRVEAKKLKPKKEKHPGK